MEPGPLRYELRHIRYFLVLAEELHFGRAASRLAITQPPLSFNIKQLEDAVGVQLFERDTKGVELTPAGRAFLPEAKAVLAQAMRARDIALAVGTGLSGRIEIGFSGSMIYMQLPRIVDRFHALAPGVDLSLREFGLPDQVENLLHGRLDAGFVDTLQVPDGLAGDLIREEPYVCCLPADHPLAGSETIDISALAGEGFVIFRREGSPRLYDRFVAFCADAGFEPIIRHAVRQWLTIIALVAEGLGVALVPRRMSQTRFGNTKFIPITPHQITSAGYLIWNPMKVPASLETLRTAVAELGAETAES
jgi:DNA-binding transcriptional LysR family regulator